jgi:hypothetical protein
MKVLVTGAGSPTGVAVIRSLKLAGHDVLACDPNPFAPGAILAGKRSVCPWASEPSDWQDWALEAAEQYQPDAAVVTIVAELAAARDILPFWGASALATDQTVDKMLFSKVLVDHGVPTIDTAWTLRGTKGGRYVVKPSRGEGSRNTFVDVDAELAALLLRKFPTMIVQPMVIGREWEADVFASGGELLGGVAYWKDRMNGGVTWAATTFELDVVWDLLADTIAACDLDGPLNIGGFSTADGHIMCEVNGRFSHNFRIGQSAGADPMRFYLDFLLGHNPDPAMLAARPGVRFERYLSETAWAS